MDFWGEMSLGPWEWALFIVAGIFTGIINTLAGSGSLITLPIFTFICGLPADVANGTNRIGALMQGGVGIYGFYRAGKLPLAGTVWLLVPAVAGGALGAWLARQLTAETLNLVIGGLMVFMLLVLMVNPKRWLRESKPSAARNRRPWSILAFFLIGLYGGFIQAGVGIFLLAGLVLAAHYGLSEANGIKMLIVFLFNIPAIILFWDAGQVHLAFGLTMAIFQSIGAVIGVRFVAKVPKANVWIHRLLLVIVVVAASKYLGLWDLLMS